MREFEGRVAVVTGAASGIGRALAECFAGERMRVVLADVEADALESARAALATTGAEVIAVRTDVAKADEVERLADATITAFGKVHVVCNNAGVFTGGRAWQAPLSDYEWVFGVNVWGVLHGVRSFLPRMLALGEPGHIVNTASMAGVTNAPMASAYYMSKHAVVALSESLFHELAMENAPIGVSVLCPEMVHTGIARSERNRPAHLQRGALEDDPGRDVVEGSIRELIHLGVPPATIAARVLQGIRDDRFWILSEEGGAWRDACDTRLEDIRLARNPTLKVTGAN